MRMALGFFEASPYAHLGLDESRIGRNIRFFLDGPKTERIALVLEHEGKAVGVLLAQTTTIIFAELKVGLEVMWWVEPEFRGKRKSFDLIFAFESWARTVGCTLTQLTTVETYQADKIGSFYKRIGYEVAETNFLKEL